eukprot:CAMPEP_0177254760 /NCGR_PEP_ID=MMETSP0367-20130122/55967_1 /TAXON_ID=447022 ORGANISM="Scrippsiella hangoei-like, Strain SHHI-4" /NCGR_SAMPLE_ID=MMETSP0367 /ASSEMBLY_ACC=CAM_ASM_000362 /LENGTH=61 /DNA_ID=CAMNT_0018708373 /DNA_START=17 /DNA_END=199 /DNA_ORIENTATION=-
MAIKGLGKAYLGGHGGSVTADKLTIRHNSGFTVFNECHDDWMPQSIMQFQLLGKTMSFSVD